MAQPCDHALYYAVEASTVIRLVMHKTNILARSIYSTVFSQAQISLRWGILVASRKARASKY
jgi:hypothetical protein